MLVIMAWAGSSVVAQTTIPPRRVLVLYSDERLLPANLIADEAIRATFAAESKGRIEFHSEFLDVSRFPGEAQQQRERDFLGAKYLERPPDLVIAGGGPCSGVSAEISRGPVPEQGIFARMNQTINAERCRLRGERKSVALTLR
jgi:hypothetical protein